MYCRLRAPLEQPFGAGPAPNTGLAPGPAHPSLFGLAPCGVYPASVITAGAVRSYRTFSPLPTSTEQLQSAAPRSGRYVFCGTSRPRAFTPASRTLSGTLPCGVRTFLSRRFALSRGVPAATAQSSCQGIVYREIDVDDWARTPVPTKVTCSKSTFFFTMRTNRAKM